MKTNLAVNEHTYARNACASGDRAIGIGFLSGFVMEWQKTTLSRFI